MQLVSTRSPVCSAVKCLCLVQIVAGKLDGTMFSKAGAEEIMAASRPQPNGSHAGVSPRSSIPGAVQTEKADTREMAVAARASSRVLQSLSTQVRSLSNT